MSAFDSYRTLLRIVGPAYLVVAFLGRIPLAMSQLATLLVVSQEFDSYALGGIAAGALAVTNAIGSPVAGALADRFGQRPVVLTQSIAGAVGLAAIVGAAAGTETATWAIIAAAVTGLFIPQVGPLARVRWRPILTDEPRKNRLVDAAFSLEGAQDELSFVVGPAAVGAFAVILDPQQALLVGAAMLLVFGSWFALHRTAALVPGTPRSSSPIGGPKLWTSAFAVLMVAQFCVGAVFGSTQTGTTALATSAGSPDSAGLIHAVLGIGSVVAALLITMLPGSVLYSTRMMVAAAALTVLSIPLLWVDSIPALIAVIAVLGFAVAPYMISNFALAGLVVPTRAVGTAMTFLAAATGLGYAAGTSLAGALADWGGHNPAYGVTVAASTTALVVAVAAQSKLRTARVVNY